MTAYVLRRLLASLLLLLLVLSLTFFLVHLAPGDPVQILIGSDVARVSPQQREELRHLYGLDRPLPVQFGLWLRALLLEGNWGYSLHSGRPVTRLVVEHLWPTLILALAALAIQYGVGLALGAWSARRAGSWGDRVVRLVLLALYSLPIFWLGLLALLLLSYTWRLFPGGHLHSPRGTDLTPFASLLDLLWHLALPALVLGLGTAASVARYTRNSLLEVLQQDYLRTARAAGVGERRVLWLHALRNAVVPLIQHAGIALPLLLSGALVTETVFSWPGLGRLSFDAIGTRDYPVILAATALTGALVVIGTLCADLLQAVVDPRVRR